LRSVPMAALHDGEKFLVQKYAIATTPSLTLTEKKALDRKQLRALIIGLTKEAVVDGRRFPALSNVGKEVSQVKARMPGSKGLLDEEFTSDRLQQELSQTPNKSEASWGTSHRLVRVGGLCLCSRDFNRLLKMG